jgi:two-component system OmpR family response regulator
MRNQNIVRDLAERRGAAPTVAVLAPANSYAAPVARRSRRELRGAMRTLTGSPDVTELNFCVDGFSVVVRVFLDGVSTIRGSGRVATEAQSLLLSTLETAIRGSCQPATRLLSRSMPGVAETGLDAEVNTMPQTTPPPTVLRIGDLELDLLERRARRCDRLIALRPREFGLLRYMMERSDKLLTRAKLLQEVWNYKFVPQTNLVDVHMGRLRRKVDGTNEPAMIRSVRGGGFVLSAHPLTQS